MSWLLKRRLDESESVSMKPLDVCDEIWRQNQLCFCVWTRPEHEQSCGRVASADRNDTHLVSASCCNDRCLITLALFGLHQSLSCIKQFWVLFWSCAGPLCVSHLLEARLVLPLRRAAAPHEYKQSGSWWTTNTGRPDGRWITGCQSGRVWCGWFSPAGRLQDTDSRSLHLQTDERARGCNGAPDTRLCLLPAETLCCLHSSGILISDWSISLVRRCLDSSGSACVRVTAPCSWLITDSGPALVTSQALLWVG